MYKAINDSFLKGLIFGGVYVGLGIIGSVICIDSIAKKYIK